MEEKFNPNDGRSENVNKSIKTVKYNGSCIR